MKVYEIEDQVFYRKLPKKLDISTGSYSPVNEALFEDLGGTITVNEKTLTPTEETFRDSACCQKFRAICGQIGNAIGAEDFKGGYDEIPLLSESNWAKEHPVEALIYSAQWQAADDECNYKGEKFGRPDWWYICWNLTPPEK